MDGGHHLTVRHRDLCMWLWFWFCLVVLFVRERERERVCVCVGVFWAVVDGCSWLAMVVDRFVVFLL